MLAAMLNTEVVDRLGTREEAMVVARVVTMVQN